MIRIVKTVPTKSGAQRWASVNQEHIAAITAKEVEVSIWGLPTVDIEEITSEHEADSVAAEHTRLAELAQYEGFDAIAMGCLIEPGVIGAKHLLSIPVVGAGEAALLTAMLIGERIGIVCCSAASANSTSRMVRRHGLANHVVTILSIESRPLDFAAQEPWIANAMLKSAQKAIGAFGADVIIGYGGLHVIEYLRNNLDVPVVSAVQAQIVLAEALVRMGLHPSKRAFPWPKETSGK
jgi:allantoin racemase